MILLTGINGLIGQQIAKGLVHKNQSVRALVRDIKAISVFEDWQKNIEYIEGDILDIPSLEVAFEGISHVIHAAAVVSFAPKDEANLYKTNIEGTANVVNVALYKKIDKLLYISSIAALGRPDMATLPPDVETLINETQKWEDSPYNSAYAKSKYGGELEVWRAAAEGLKTVIVNPSVVLGEGDWHKSSTQLFKYVYDKKKFYTEGLINYVDVNDVARACVQLLFLDIENERFVLSAGHISYKDLFGKMAKGFNTTPPPYKVSPLMAEVVWRLEAVRSWFTGKAPLLTKETARTARTKFVYDNAKIKKALDFEFTPLAETVERVCGFLKET